MNQHLRALVVSCSLAVSASAQASWSMLYPTSSPPGLQLASMACHEASGTAVLFGGTAPGDPYSNECWLLNQDSWSEHTGVVPTGRLGTAMAYDSKREVIVLFAGRTSSASANNDLWEWDGSTWQPRISLPMPPARRYHSMAYDRNRGVTVLFGGDDTNNELEDVWEWDGTSWVDKTPATSGPGSRVFAGLAFDPLGGGVILFGGRRSGQLMNETWSWDGVQWTQRTPATPPSRRYFATLTTDLHRQRVLLHGGEPGDPFSWEWDGNEWNLLLLASPGAIHSHAAAYNPAERRTVLFGGQQIDTDFNLADTWQFQTPYPAIVTQYGAGCTGSAGTPTLAGAIDKLPWIGDTFRTYLTSLEPNAAFAAIATGYAPTVPVPLDSFGMTGCELHVAFAALDIVPTATGTAIWETAIPASTALAGAQVFQQGLSIDVAANPAGLTVSNAIEIVMGVR